MAEKLVDTHVLDNIVVKQKDRILAMINNQEFEQAHAAIEITRELWASMEFDYSYKTAELENRLRQAIAQK